MALEIEKGIPIPRASHRSKNIEFTEALRELEIGDSVVLPVGSQGAGMQAHNDLGKGNYACRKVPGGTRVWRTK